eukprot:6273583-Prymnesium_polylepis.1
MVAPSDAPAWGRGPLSGPSKKQKAAAAVRTAAAKFGPAQQKQANAWVEQALKGMSTESLIEEELNLFGECALSEEGSKEPNKCIAMSKVRQAEPDSRWGCHRVRHPIRMPCYLLLIRLAPRLRSRRSKRS